MPRQPRVTPQGAQRARRAARMIPGAAAIDSAMSIFDAPGQNTTRAQNTPRQAARIAAETEARRRRNLANDCARHGDC